ncbi:MAG: ribonuclease III [Anaerolineae bacterium]|nr:ribonuclease III [Anaerolineae bacterium]
MSRNAESWDVGRAEQEIGVTFKDPSLLEEALTHSSYVNENPEVQFADSQRLEFLGDAILDFVVGEWLFARYSDAREGELTSIRARLVQTSGLARLAREIHLGAFLRLGRGEEGSGGRARPANLCAAFEALVGAIYRDQGIDLARRFVRGFLERHAQEIDAARALRDPKSLLQEYTQAHLRATPHYRIVHEEGPDHAKRFTARVSVKQEVWGEGTGSSKQAAEQASAEAALARCVERPRGGELETGCA